MAELEAEGKTNSNVERITEATIGTLTSDYATITRMLVRDANFSGKVVAKFPNMVGRTAANITGCGSVLSTADDATGTLTTNMFLPSLGTFGRIRTGTPTVTISETLPATADILTAVASDLPGGQWNVGESYNLWWIYNSAVTGRSWTLVGADTNTVFKGATLTLASSSSTISAYHLIRIMRLSSTQILVWI